MDADPSWVERLADIGQAILLITGIAAIATAPVRMILSRPKVEIRPRFWKGRGGEKWHFAAIEIQNVPLPRWVAPFLTRDAVYDARVTLEFRRDGELAVEPVAARWSDRPEAIRYEPVQQGSVLLLQAVPAPELVNPSMVYDLPASPRWLEVAVAVLLADGEAYAWGAESYLHNWRRADWKLERGTYDVTIRVEWGDRVVAREYVLTFLSDDFDAFQVKPRLDERRSRALLGRRRRSDIT